MIITHKEFPEYRKFEIEYEGRPLKMEVGKMAELCNAAVLVTYGETTVLVTCTASARPKDGIDYFPLAVDFNEKLYAVGRIPGSFMRREGKPSLPAVLASRLIDRPMRPLFPSDLRNDVVIACEVLSVDRDCSPEITAMIGASAAVSISDVPFNGPIAGIVLGWDGEKYLFNPTQEERKTNRMTTTIAATHKKIVMIESEADQVPEDVMYEGIVQAHEHLQPVLDLIDKMVAEIGKPKFEYEHASFDEELFGKLVENEFEGMEYCMDTDDKNVREARVNDWVSAMEEKYSEEHPDIMQYMDEILYKLQKKVVKKWLLAGKRVDGRAMNEIRPLGSEVGLIPRVHGSALFTRGQTQVLSIATLATLSMSQKLDTIWEEEEKRFMHHYNMPSYSTGEARASRSTGRREYGHGALVEKALESVIPPVEDFPYTIRVVSEILSSNGSTSQGSICGTTLALMDAGVPIKAPVAGISCGLIQDGDDFTTFIDIQGVEDFHGEMDFKVAGTKDGITAIQTTAGAAARASLAGGVGGHVVVVHEALLFLFPNGVELLAHGKSCERCYRQHLGLTTGEQSRTVNSGDDADLGAEGADLIHCTAVDTLACKQPLFDDLLLQLVEYLIHVLHHVGVLVGVLFLHCGDPLVHTGLTDILVVGVHAVFHAGKLVGDELVEKLLVKRSVLILGLQPRGHRYDRRIGCRLHLRCSL